MEVFQSATLRYQFGKKKKSPRIRILVNFTRTCHGGTKRQGVESDVIVSALITLVYDGRNKSQSYVHFP